MSLKTLPFTKLCSASECMDASCMPSLLQYFSASSKVYVLFDIKKHDDLCRSPFKHFLLLF